VSREKLYLSLLLNTLKNMRNKQRREGDILQKQFIWDEEKQKTNIKKHGVAFEEAATVFDDEKAIYFDDERHSQNEDRFIILGYSNRARMLMVCHCYRNDNSLIRIISARKATRLESNQYGGA
jgi:uncharacterized DUF497 family protein